jgi:hypothetical protein
MFETRSFKTAIGQTRNGVLYLPDDYSTTTDQLALLAWCHGRGEAGTNTEGLYMHGPLGNARMGQKMEGISRADGSNVKFCIFAIQDINGWSPSPEQITYAIENDVLIKYPRINKKMIYITGFSAGGDSCLQAITKNATMGLYAAAIPMAPASTGNLANIQATANAGIYVMGFCGNQDEPYLSNLRSFESKLNGLVPGRCRTFIWSGGHGTGGFYDPNYKNNLWGQLMSLYDFLASAAKGSGWNPAAVPTTSLKAVLLPGDAVINTTSVVMDASTSQNVKTEGGGLYPWDAFQWSVKPVIGNNWDVKWKVEGADIGGMYGPAKRTLINLRNGDIVQVTVTVKGIDGKTSTVSSEISVQLSPANKAPTVDAGQDITINAPMNAVNLAATAVDLDGKITGYKWTQQSGPNQALIENPVGATTRAAGLIPGYYIFGIEVSDNVGAKVQDTVAVTVAAYSFPKVQIGQPVIYEAGTAAIGIEPCAAVVTKVLGEDMVNLMLFPDLGTPMPRSSVRSKPIIEGGPYWQPLE